MLRTVAVCIASLAVISEQGRAQSFRSRADGVTVDVSVTSGKNEVRSLSAADFELTDNGVRQQLLEVAREELPLDVTLVVDVSGGGILASAVGAGVEKIRGALTPDDRIRVVTFDDRVHEHGPLGPPASMPRVTGPQKLDAFTPSAQTSLFDATALALETRREPGRQAVVILFSAGRDTRSKLVSSQALELARRADVPVFVVHARLTFQPVEPPPEGATARPVPVDQEAVPQRFYKELAEITGGTVQTVEPLTVRRNDSEMRSMRVRIGDPGLSEAFLRALEDFRTSYVLRYTPRDGPWSGWHAVAVRVTKPGRYTVRARKGYFVE